PLEVWSFAMDTVRPFVSVFVPILKAPVGYVPCDLKTTDDGLARLHLAKAFEDLFVYVGNIIEPQATQRAAPSPPANGTRHGILPAPFDRWTSNIAERLHGAGSLVVTRFKRLDDIVGPKRAFQAVTWAYLIVVAGAVFMAYRAWIVGYKGPDQRA